MVKIEGTEANICYLLVPSMSHAPKTMHPTFPIMQRDRILHYILPVYIFQTLHTQLVMQSSLSVKILKSQAPI